MERHLILDSVDSTAQYANECVEPECSIEGCGGAHHRLLHRPTNPSRESGKVSGREAPPQINPLERPFYQAKASMDVLVKTALVRIKSPLGLEKTVRVMFDEISEKIWIRKGLADERRLDGTKEAVVVTTFGQKVEKPVTSHKVELYLADKEGNNWVKFKAIAVDEVGAPASALRVTTSVCPNLKRSNSQTVTQEECKMQMS